MIHKTSKSLLHRGSMVKSVRICLVGSSAGSGTTSAIIQYIHGSFPQTVPTTCDPAPLPFALHKTASDSKEVIHLIICDVSANQSSIYRDFQYNQADLILVTFNTALFSKKNILTRIKEVSKYPNVPFGIMGCKSDLRDDPNRSVVKDLTVSVPRGQKMATAYGAFAYFDTSALRGTGFRTAITDCIMRVLNPPKKFLWWAVKTPTAEQSRIERIPTKTASKTVSSSSSRSETPELDVDQLIAATQSIDDTRSSTSSPIAAGHIRKTSIDASVHSDGWTEISWHQDQQSSIGSDNSTSPALHPLTTLPGHTGPYESSDTVGKHTLSPDSDPNSHIRIVQAELERLSSNLQQETLRVISFLKSIFSGISHYLVTKYRFSKHKLEIGLFDAAEVGNDKLYAKLQDQLCHLIFPTPDVIIEQFNRLKLSVPPHMKLSDYISSPIPEDSDILSFNPRNPSSGNTPLHIATISNQLKIIQVILYGPYGLLTPSGKDTVLLASVNHVNNNGKTARDLAMDLSHRDIFNLLSEEKALKQPKTGLPKGETFVDSSDIGNGYPTNGYPESSPLSPSPVSRSSISINALENNSNGNLPLENAPLEPLEEDWSLENQPLENQPLEGNPLLVPDNQPLERSLESPSEFLHDNHQDMNENQPLEEASPTHTPSPPPSAPGFPPIISVADHSSPILSITLPGSTPNDSLTQITFNGTPQEKETPEFQYQRSQWKKFRKLMDEISPFFGLSSDTIGMRDPKELETMSENSPLSYSDKKFVPQGNFNKLLTLFSTVTPVAVSGSQSFELLALVETIHSLREAVSQKRATFEKKLYTLYKSFRNQAATLSFESGRLNARSIGSDGPMNILFLSAYPYSTELEKLDTYQNEITLLANQLSKIEMEVSYRDVFPEKSQPAPILAKSPQIQLLALHVKERTQLANKIIPSIKDTLTTCNQLRALAQFATEQLDNLVNTLDEKFTSALALEKKAQQNYVPKSPRRPSPNSSPNSSRFLAQSVPFPLLTNARDSAVPVLISKAKTVLNTSLKPLLEAQSKVDGITDTFSNAFQDYITTTMSYQGQIVHPQRNQSIALHNSPETQLLENLSDRGEQPGSASLITHRSLDEAPGKTPKSYQWETTLQNADTSGFGGLGVLIGNHTSLHAHPQSPFKFDVTSLPSLEETWSFIQQIVPLFINEVRSTDLPEWENLQEFVSQLLSHIQVRFEKYNESNLPADSTVIQIAKMYSKTRHEFWEFEDQFYLLDSKIRVAKRRSLPIIQLIDQQSHINSKMIDAKSKLSTLQSQLFSFAHHGRPEILAILPVKSYSSPLFDPARNLTHYSNLVPIVHGENGHSSHSVFTTKIKPNVSTVISPVDGPVVLKQYKLKDPIDQNSFDRELACFEILSHPFLAAVSCVFTDADAEHGYTEQEKMAHSSLQSWASTTNASFAQKIRLLQDLFVAVSYIHSRGLVHGDLSPSNILVDDQNRPRITDFDSARAAQFISNSKGDDSTPEPSHSASTSFSTRFTSLPTILLGHPDLSQITPHYSSPELALSIQMDGSGENLTQYTPETDMWSISAAALSIFSENEGEFQTFLSDKDPSHLSSILPSNDDSGQKTKLVELFSSTLSKSPSQRMSASEALAHPLFASNPLEDIDINLSEVIDVSSILDNSVAPVSDKNILMSGATRWKLFKNIFEEHTKKLRGLHSLVTKNVNITRANVVEPILEIMTNASDSDCHNLRIKVKFKGEPSIDAGGPGREGLTLFFGASPIQQINRGDTDFATSSVNEEREVDLGVFDKKYNLFDSNPETGKCLPIAGDLTFKQKKNLTAFGKLMGACLINGFTVTDLPLVVPAFYRILWYGVDHIRTHPKSWQLKHLEAYSGKLSGLRQIMAWKDAEMLEACGFSFVPRGGSAEVDVTMDNRAQYFQNYIWDSLVRQRKEAWKALRKGFIAALTNTKINNGKFSGAMMALCGPTDIALLLGASGHVDVELLISKCLYIERSGWSGAPDDPNYTPNLLLDWMRTTSQANLQKFLFFVTASTSLPNNPRSSTVRKAIFKCAGSQKNRLPQAATCSLTLKCPDYHDKQILATRLEQAIMTDDFGNR